MRRYGSPVRTRAQKHAAAVQYATIAAVSDAEKLAHLQGVKKYSRAEAQEILNAAKEAALLMGVRL